jgi:aminoglycoside phosphotransferase (APT) family kinase protein
MIAIDEKKLKDYISSQFGSKVKVKSIEKLGEGFHALAFAINVVENNKEKKFVMKIQRGEAFGQEYPADRASSVIRALMDQNLLEDSVKVFDAGSIQADGSLLSFGKPEEFFIIMEEAKGENYWRDMDNIRNVGKLSKKDEERIKILAQYLANMHKIKYEGSNADNLYKRVVRDFIGHGELTMGIIDTFPDKLSFVSRSELVDIVKKTVEWWDVIKNKSNRLTVIHGDFYPSNIFFDNEKLIITDRSRFRFGDPADDVSAFVTNLINYSVATYGDFRDPFKKLFELFFEEYFRNRKDDEMFEVLPLFFSFRALVAIHPVFYSAEWFEKHGFDKNSISKLNEKKIEMVNFAKNVLEDDKFQINKINSYLGLE